MGDFTTDSLPSTVTTASVRLRLSPTPLARSTPVFPLPTPTPPATPTTSDTPPTLATATSPPLLSTVLLPPLSTLESTLESTLDSLPSTATTTATTATSSDKSSKDWEPKPIGPNVAPWWRKPIVLLTCVTCAMNQK